MTLTIILENVNLCFAALFGVEMLLKVIGDGLYGYIRDGFNVFDGLIVLLRLAHVTFVNVFYCEA
jgi:voltage-dependent calcium channel T type alpha-1G